MSGRIEAHRTPAQGCLHGHHHVNHQHPQGARKVCSTLLIHSPALARPRPATVLGPREGRHSVEWPPSSSLAIAVERARHAAASRLRRGRIRVLFLCSDPAPRGSSGASERDRTG